MAEELCDPGEGKITKIEIMADYGSCTGFWFYYPIYYERIVAEGIPIPKDLYDMVESWNDLYNRYNPTDGSVWSARGIWNALGLKLAKKVKGVVGDSLEVIYFDEELCDRVIIMGNHCEESGCSFQGNYPSSKSS